MESINTAAINTERGMRDMLERMASPKGGYTAKALIAIRVDWTCVIPEVMNDMSDIRAHIEVRKNSADFRFFGKLRPCANATCTTKITGEYYRDHDYCHKCER